MWPTRIKHPHVPGRSRRGRYAVPHPPGRRRQASPAPKPSVPPPKCAAAGLNCSGRPRLGRAAGRLAHAALPARRAPAGAWTRPNCARAPPASAEKVAVALARWCEHIRIKVKVPVKTHEGAWARVAGACEMAASLAAAVPVARGVARASCAPPNRRSARSLRASRGGDVGF